MGFSVNLREVPPRENNAIAHDTAALEWYQGFISPGASTPLSLLMIQGSRFCNIDCRYCYLPNRSDKKRIDLADVAELIRKLTDSSLLGREITVLWHAGEPLVLPAEFYREAFTIVNDTLVGKCTAVHNIQTNATLITDEFCDLFREYNVKVGVSIDGPARLHDAMRVTRKGTGTHAKTLAGLELLQRRGLSPSSICVLGNDSLHAPDEIYDFFVSTRIRQVGFSVEEQEGNHQTTSLQHNDVVFLYKNFMRRIYERLNRDGHPFSVREFRLAPLIASAAMAPSRFRPMESNELSIISMNVDGKIFTYSPELVDLKRSDGSDFSIGHVSNIDFTKLYNCASFKNLKSEIDHGVELCRTSCKYFYTCGGGAPVNKLCENGTFASTETIFCKLTQQAMSDLVREVLPSMPGKENTLIATQHSAADRKSSGAATEIRRLVPTSPARVNIVLQPRKQTENKEGTPLCAFSPGRALVPANLIDENRISLSRGTILARNTAQKEDYDEDAIVPEGGWRFPSAEERALLTSTVPKSTPLVNLVKLPGELNERLRAISEQSSEASDTHPLAVPEQIGSEIAKLFAEAGSSWRLLGAISMPSGRLTSTVNSSTGKRLGLHVDSWSKLPPSERAVAPNRLCVNLGRAPRFLLLLGLPIDLIIEQIEAAGLTVPSHPTEIGRLFMRLHPRYPVLRLEIRPGEAYIAPTEYLIHDGYTLGSNSPDITLTLIGKFLTFSSSERAPDELTDPDQLQVAGALATKHATSGSHRVRPAKEEDLPVLVEMCARLHAESAYKVVAFHSKKLEHVFKSALRNPQQCVFVYERGNDLIGFFFGRVDSYFFSDELAAYDVVFYVEPRHRGSLAAYRLWNAFKGWAKANGARLLWPGISTGVELERTEKFYRGLGLMKVGTVFRGPTS